MPDASLLTHPVLLPVWVVIGVFIAEAVLPVSTRFHPLTVIRILADRMAHRVHPSTQRSVTQQQISGGLGFVVLLAPFILIIGLFGTLVEFPVLFDALLLFIACEYRSVRRQTRRVYNALKAEHKALARNLLANQVLRETEKLSPMGVGKAALETLQLRFVYQIVTPVLLFVLFGAVIALAYRLLYDTAQVWNPSQARFRHFGKPLRKTLDLIQWLPIRLFILIAALSESLRGAFTSSKQAGKCPRLRILTAIGGALGVQLGGPAYYDGLKTRLAKVGGNREIKLADLPRGLTATIRMQAVMTVMVLLACTAQYGFVALV